MRRGDGTFGQQAISPLTSRFEIVIKSPTLGLMTRVPGDQPDPRYACVASNVRFDDGVIRNAPGCSPLITSPVLDSPATLIFQCSTSPSTGAQKLSAVLICSEQKIYSLQNVSETEFPLLQDQVINFHGEISSHNDIRQMPTAGMLTPWVLAVSINDDMELWKFRPRASTSEVDDDNSVIVTNDYGAETNNNVFVRIA